MQWIDQALIIAINKHGENAAIITVLTKEHGLHSGIISNITGRNSTVYQLGNLVKATWSARLSEHLGKFSLELNESFASCLISDRLRLTALSSICSVIQHSLTERTPELDIYHAFYNLLRALKINDSNWLKKFIFLEVMLLSKAGFGLDLTECAVTSKIDDLTHVSPKTGRAVSSEIAGPYIDKLLVLPEFMINQSEEAVSQEDLINGLIMCSYFLEKHIFLPKKLSLPIALKQLKILLSELAES